jgi:hypothetical protein
VRLVDDEHRDARHHELVEDVGIGELLGRQEEELERVLGEVGQHVGAFARRHGGVQLRGVAGGALAQVFDLVALQCDQRRDHDGGALSQQTGDLVDRRLPRPGRHHGQGVPIVEHGLDGLALAGAQQLEAEALPGDACDCLRPGRHRRSEVALRRCG